MSQKRTGMTRREFLVQAAATSIASSMLVTENLACAQPAATVFNAESRRRRDLEMFLKTFPHGGTPPTGRINAYDKTWEDWVKRTGALPPDFEAMQSISNLPDPLIYVENGRQIAVTNGVLWNRQKKWIHAQVEQWFFGKMPPPLTTSARLLPLLSVKGQPPCAMSGLSSVRVIAPPCVCN
jgi:hypothetical protein